MTALQLGDQRRLVRKELVERSDVDTRPLRHPIGGQPGIAVALQNVSDSLQDGVHRRPRPRLTRRFSGRTALIAPHGGMLPGCKLTIQALAYILAAGILS